jgi:hypothetical protein
MMTAVVLPDPTGPKISRPNALDFIKAAHVGDAVYSKIGM